MKPLVDQFTKNLSPCKGCGGISATEYFLTQQEKGEKMEYILSVKVEANNLVEAVAKKEEWVVIDGRPAPPPRPAPQPIKQGIQMSGQFAKTTTEQVNG